MRVAVSVHVAAEVLWGLKNYNRGQGFGQRTCSFEGLEPKASRTLNQVDPQSQEVRGVRVGVLACRLCVSIVFSTS